MVACNIFGCSAWNLLHVTLLAPIILTYLLDIWKICPPRFLENLSTGDMHQVISRGLLPWCFSTKILRAFLISPMRYERPAHVILGLVIMHIVQILGEGFKFRISSFCNFSPSSCSSFLCWNTTLSTSYWCYFFCVYKY